MRRVNIRQRLVISGIFLLSLIMPSCRNASRGVIAVTIDQQFKDLFYADSKGLTGADGLFSIPLADGSSLFLVGDCFLGEVVNGSRDIKTKMLRNAGNLIDKNQTGAVAIIRGTYEDPATFMEPVNEKGDSTYRWYWPGHGFVKNDTLYVFALNLYNEPSAAVKSEKAEDEQDEVDEMIENMFAFRISQIDLLSFTLPDFKHLETHRVEIDYQVNQIDFGNCVMTDDGYVYIYGTRNFPGIAKIHVARVPLSSRVFYSGWEYFTGTDWDKNISQSTPLDIDISVSEQFSIFRHNNRYILLTQERGGLDIYTYVSDLPHKDFHNKKFIYHTPEAEADTNRMIFTYNALAHKQYIENDRLLVSYCVNSFNVRDVFENVESYRARFLRVPLKLILSDTETN